MSNVLSFRIQSLKGTRGSASGPPAPSDDDLRQKMRRLFELEVVEAAEADPNIEVDVHLLSGAGSSPVILHVEGGQAWEIDRPAALQTVFIDLTHPGFGWAGPARSTPAVHAEGPDAERFVELLAQALVDTA